MNFKTIAIGLALVLSGAPAYPCIDIAGDWTCSESWGDPLMADSVSIEQNGTSTRSLEYRFANNSFPLDGLPHPFDTVMERGISITTCEGGSLKIFTNSKHARNIIIYSRQYDFKLVDNKLIVNQQLKLSQDGYVFRTADYQEVTCSRVIASMNH